MWLEKYSMFALSRYSSACAIVVGTTLLYLLLTLYARRRIRRPPRRSPPVLSGAASPAAALAQAARHIARGDIATLGELLFFLRGSSTRRMAVDEGTHAELARVTRDAESLSALCASPRLEPMLRGLLRCTEQAARLEAERATPFDGDCAAHMELLRALWTAAGKPPEDFAQRSKEWGSMGFQGLDPTTDFRGGGVLALRVLAHFVETHNEAFGAMMEYNRAVLAAGEDSWYLPAVVSIQFTSQILLREYDLYLPQLETLCDTVRHGDDRARARAAIAARRGDVSVLKAVWAHESDLEVGFFTLHHQLLLHFMRCWHRDKPHVMSYGTYINTVLKSFFTPDE